MATEAPQQPPEDEGHHLYIDRNFIQGEGLIISRLVVEKPQKFSHVGGRHHRLNSTSVQNILGQLRKDSRRPKE